MRCYRCPGTAVRDIDGDVTCLMCGRIQPIGQSIPLTAKTVQRLAIALRKEFMAAIDGLTDSEP